MSIRRGTVKHYKDGQISLAEHEFCNGRWEIIYVGDYFCCALDLPRKVFDLAYEARYSTRKGKESTFLYCHY